MVDCQHWIEPMLEAAEAELANERLIREKERLNMRKAISEIRTIIDGAEFALGKKPDLLSEELYQQAQMNQMRAMQMSSSPHGNLFAALGGGAGYLFGR